MRILELYDEDQTVSSRRFPEKVKSRLNLTVRRSTVQKIIKEKEQILSVPAEYRKAWCHRISKVQQKFEKELYNQVMRKNQEDALYFRNVRILGVKILNENEEFESLRHRMKLSAIWWQKWKLTYGLKVKPDPNET